MVKGQKSKEQLDSLFFTFHFSLFTYMSTPDFWSNYDNNLISFLKKHVIYTKLTRWRN